MRYICNYFILLNYVLWSCVFVYECMYQLYVQKSFCYLLQGVYIVRILENSKGGKFVINVFVIDKDKGDYGVVRYVLDFEEIRFIINNISVSFLDKLVLLKLICI